MSDNLDTSGIRDLVEDATRYHGTPWRRVVTSDGGFYGVTDRNGAVVAGSPAVTALIAQAPTLIPELLDRLEQAEQAVARVREVIHQYDPDCLTCMCNSDGDCCKCTVADFQEALDGDGRG